jgi:hypothetical protein
VFGQNRRVRTNSDNFDVFGQMLINSDKIEVFGQLRCVRTTSMCSDNFDVFGQLRCVRITSMCSDNFDVFGQLRTKSSGPPLQSQRTQRLRGGQPRKTKNPKGKLFLSITA